VIETGSVSSRAIDLGGEARPDLIDATTARYPWRPEAGDERDAVVGHVGRDRPMRHAFEAPDREAHAFRDPELRDRAGVAGSCRIGRQTKRRLKPVESTFCSSKPIAIASLGCEPAGCSRWRRCCGPYSVTTHRWRHASGADPSIGCTCSLTGCPGLGMPSVAINYPMSRSESSCSSSRSFRRRCCVVARRVGSRQSDSVDVLPNR
jgi:hypothetical protein